MEELEPPIEHVHETIHHHAHHTEAQWITWVALSTALLAGLAAVAALLSGYHANTAVIEQVKASDQWAYYQAKGIKQVLVQENCNLLKAMGKTVSAEEKSELAKYKGQKTELHDKAQAMQDSSREHFERHEMLARSVTLFQVAIAIAAIAVLTKLPWFWYLGLAFGAAATGFLIYGIVFTPQPEEEAKESAAPTNRVVIQWLCLADENVGGTLNVGGAGLWPVEG